MHPDIQGSCPSRSQAGTSHWPRAQLRGASCCLPLWAEGVCPWGGHGRVPKQTWQGTGPQHLAREGRGLSLSPQQHSFCNLLAFRRS